MAGREAINERHYGEIHNKEQKHDVDKEEYSSFGGEGRCQVLEVKVAK